MRKKLTKNFWNIEVWAVQKHVNLVDLVKSFPTNILLQNLASIQKRTSPVKFDYLAEKSNKIRYRTLPWFFSQMSKLYRARSPLYRRQILQENIRWKALDEIYKMYMLLHRSDLNISKNFRQKISHFSQKFAKIRYFWILFTDFCSDFDENLSEFRR